MAQSIKNSHVFDYVIYGSDLTSQIIATFLSLENNNVLYIEKPLSLGHFLNHPDENTGQKNYLDSNFQFCPQSNQAVEMLKWLEEILNETLISETTDRPTYTFDSGNFKSFVGFGERTFQSTDAILHYFSQHQIELSSPALSWQKIFKNAFQGQSLLQSQITSVEIEQEELTSITVNAQKKIYTKNLVYCAEPKELLLLLDKKGLTKKNKQSLSKPTILSKLVISFIHLEDKLETLSQKDALHVLMGTKDDFEPTMGKFKNNCSTWVSYFEEMQAEGFDEVGALLKNMKRQIKRAYPLFFDSVESEKISVAANAQAYFDFQFKNYGQLDQLHNFWVFSPQFFKQYPIIGQLQAARSAIKALDLSENLSETINEAPAKTNPSDYAQI